MSQMSGLRLVRFATEDSEFEGFAELMKAGQGVRLVKNRDYVITDKQCELLKARHVDYEIIEKL